MNVTGQASKFSFVCKRRIDQAFTFVFQIICGMIIGPVLATVVVFGLVVDALAVAGEVEELVGYCARGGGVEVFQVGFPGRTLSWMGS